MSFTCPGCLWTSHHPQDVLNRYCGHCHTFEDADFAPSDLEKALIHALRAPAELAAQFMRVVASGFDQAAPFSVVEMAMAVTRLSDAQRITQDQRDLLVYAAQLVEQMQRLSPPDWGMTSA